MLDPEVLERLEEIVREKVTRGTPFTAYDITQQLRGEKYWVKHTEARVEVHRLFDEDEMAGFDRCLVNKGGPTPAWQYFPVPSLAGYKGGLTFTGTLPSHLTPSQFRAYGAGSPTAESGGIAVRLDRRATVCIPARLVRQVALRPGDRVQVFVDALHALLRIRPGRPGSALPGLPARRYTVDRHYNIRIPRGTQARAGLRGARRQIQAQPDELIVRDD